MIDECFKLFLTLITKNEKLFAQFKTDEKIKQTLINLIKKDMDTKTRNFIGELKRYLNNFSSKKQGINKLDYEFLIYLFEISNTIFNELIINKIDINNDKDKSKSILYYFEYFSQLLKEILTNIIASFISLIYPLQYPYPVITILPEQNFSLITLFDHFIFGINAKYSEDYLNKKWIIQKLK